MKFYDFQVKDSEGKEVSMEEYKGKVVLVVNVASECGFTPQYEGLQALYSKYKDRDFIILGFPSNQFMGQEPGTNEEIQSFCKLNYGVEFPVFAKIDVNGEKEDPFYTFLKEERKERADEDTLKGKVGQFLLETLGKMEKKSDIVWNFEKFLVDKEGNVVGRFSSSKDPKDLDEIIAMYL